MAIPAVSPLTVDEFLVWDSGDDRLYEFIEGVPVAMVKLPDYRAILSVAARRFMPMFVSAELPAGAPPSSKSNTR
jgi:hypothetical protein